MRHLSELRSLQQTALNRQYPAGITEFILLPFVGQEAPKPLRRRVRQPALADALLLTAVARIFWEVDSQSSASCRWGLPVPQLSQQRYRRHVDGGTHYHNGWRSRWHLYGSRDYKLLSLWGVLTNNEIHFTVPATSLIPAVPIQDRMDVDFCLLYKMKRYWSLLALVLVVVII